MLRTCNYCHIEKDIIDFMKDKKSPSGYSHRCKACGREITRLWRLNNLGRSRSYGRARYWSLSEEDRKKRIEASKAYGIAHRQEHSRKVLERYHADPKHNLRTRIISRLCDTIRTKKPKNRKWFELLGYNADDLKKHLERRFKDGMSWDNYGEWHIDHIIPVSAHNFQSPDDVDFKKCWALKNLQPLWAKDNLRKHARIDKPFQPSLQISL
jgi:hypothetical protein